jgi:dihydroneopterin aldolase
MGVIVLEKLHFKAYHGYYDEEREKGNHFELDVKVITDFTDAAENDDLHGTVDYSEMYRIIKEQMQIPSRLLENVAFRIATQLLQTIGAIDHVEIRLSKLNAPIGGPCHAATIVYEQSRS